MAVAYGTQTTATATTTSITINVPTGTAAGDVLVAAINTGSGNTSFTPQQSGWSTLLAYFTDNNDTAGQLFYRIATGSEPASYGFTMTAVNDATGSMIRFTGVDTTTPIRASRYDHASGTGASYASTALTGVQSGDLTVQTALMGDDAGSTTFTVTQPGTPWSSVNSFKSGPKYQGSVYATGARSGATWTSSSATAIWNIATYALASASAAGASGTCAAAGVGGASLSGARDVPTSGPAAAGVGAATVSGFSSQVLTAAGVGGASLSGARDVLSSGFTVSVVGAASVVGFDTVRGVCTAAGVGTGSVAGGTGNTLLIVNSKATASVDGFVDHRFGLTAAGVGTAVVSGQPLRVGTPLANGVGTASVSGRLTEPIGCLAAAVGAAGLVGGLVTRAVLIARGVGYAQFTWGALAAPHAPVEATLLLDGVGSVVGLTGVVGTATVTGGTSDAAIAVQLLCDAVLSGDGTGDALLAAFEPVEATITTQ